MHNVNVNPAEILPHKYPFLFFDRVLEIEKGKRVVCLKNISIDEELLAGYFRDDPVLPAILIIEAMAQASGLLLAESSLRLNTDSASPKLAFLAAIKDAKFMRTVSAGDQMKIISILIQDFAPLYTFEAKVFVNDEVAAESGIVLSDAG